MGSFVPEIIADYLTVQTLHYALWGILIAFACAFFALFVPGWLALRRRLTRFLVSVRGLKASRTSPRELTVEDQRLEHLWSQYANTLHQPDGAADPRTGLASSFNYRATVPAEAIFTAQSVYEWRIYTEFFKHLPGLLTGQIAAWIPAFSSLR
jgi:hypothetical protein